MPRKIRLCKLHSRYHVMLRGVAGQSIFLDDKDRVRLCLILQAASEKHEFLIHAFCFMKNHLHFILEPKRDSLSECVHGFAFRYAQYFNKRHNRQGYLFQGRFRSILVDDGLYLKRLIRYIHLNPLEACVIKCPKDYRWSSHRAYLGINDYTWLSKELILSRFADIPEEAILRFVEFIVPHPEVEVDSVNIIQSFNCGVYGSDKFIEEFTAQKIISKQLHELPKKTLLLDEALIHVCNKYQISLEDLASNNKQKHIVDARSVLAFLARTGKQDWNLQNIAALLNKNHGTVSRLASRAKAEPILVSYAHSLLLP